jgi:hypothetical protein
VTTIIYAWRGTRRVRRGGRVALCVYARVSGAMLILVGILGAVGNRLFLRVLNAE